MTQNHLNHANQREMTFREDVRKGDDFGVEQVIHSTGFFSTEEEEIAVSLVRERLTKGEESGYHFLFAEQDEKLMGYACFGRIPGTQESFDLYWIAVHADARGGGLGKQILLRSDEIIHRLGGRRVYIETSSRKQYDPTRAFYKKTNCQQIAIFEDFYAPGDSKVVYLRKV